jgi:hypothetical protein
MKYIFVSLLLFVLFLNRSAAQPGLPRLATKADTLAYRQTGHLIKELTLTKGQAQRLFEELRRFHRSMDSIGKGVKEPVQRKGAFAATIGAYEANLQKLLNPAQLKRYGELSAQTKERTLKQRAEAVKAVKSKQ